MTDADARLIDEARSLADCDARAGEPLGKCLVRCADRIESLVATLTRIAEMTDIEADFDGFEARQIARDGLESSK